MYVCMHIHACMNMYTCTHKHIHKCKDKQMRDDYALCISPALGMYVCICADMYACTRMCVSIYTHTCIHTYTRIPAYLHIYTHTYIRPTRRGRKVSKDVCT